MKSRDRRVHLRLRRWRSPDRLRARFRTRRSPLNRLSSRSERTWSARRWPWTTTWRITCPGRATTPMSSN